MSTNETLPLTSASDWTPDTVGGMNVFWVLFVLTSATALHPLGTSLGFPVSFSRYLRILPLCSLVDVVQLYATTFQHWKAHGLPLRETARRVATLRLQSQHQSGSYQGGSQTASQSRDDFELEGQSQAQIPTQTQDQTQDHTRMWNQNGTQDQDHPDPENQTQPQTLTQTQRHNLGQTQTQMQYKIQALITLLLLDIRPRLLANAAVVLVYTKIHGFHGIPWSTAYATICFANWAGLEIFLLCAFGIRRRLPQQETTGVSLPSAANPVHGAGIGVRPLRTLAGLLTLAQGLALLGVGIFFAVASQHPARDGAHRDDGSALWRAVRWWVHVAGIPVESWGQGALDILLIPLDGWDAPLWVLIPVLGTYMVVTYTPVILVTSMITCILMFIPCYILLITPGLLIIGMEYLAGVWPGVERRIAGLGERRWLWIARACALCLLAFSLLFYNVFWNGTDTWKEDWASKLD